MTCNKCNNHDQDHEVDCNCKEFDGDSKQWEEYVLNKALEDEWIDLFLMNKLKIGRRVDNERTGASSIAGIPQELIQWCPKDTEPPSLGVPVGDKYYKGGAGCYVQKYLRVVDGMSMIVEYNPATKEETIEAEWCSLIPDCAIKGLDASKITNACALWDTLGEDISLYYDETGCKLKDCYFQAPLVLDKGENDCGDPTKCDLSVLLAFLDSDTIDVYETTTEDGCEGWAWRVKYQDTCTTTISEDENGLMVDVNLSPDGSVDLTCVEGKGIEANVNVCDCSPLFVKENVDGTKCLDICVDETMRKCPEDCSEPVCIGARAQSRSFSAGIKPKPTNIAPSEVAAFPSLEITLYPPGNAFNPPDAPVNATLNGQCYTSLPGLFEFDEIAQPPYPAPACMKWEADVQIQMNLENPLPYGPDIVFTSPITIQIRPTFNGTDLGIFNQPYTEIGEIQPNGDDLNSYNTNIQAGGIFCAQDSGNSAGLEVTICFPEGVEGIPTPTALCFGSVSFVVGRYHLVEDPDCVC